MKECSSDIYAYYLFRMFLEWCYQAYTSTDITINVIMYLYSAPLVKSDKQTKSMPYETSSEVAFGDSGLLAVEYTST